MRSVFLILLASFVMLGAHLVLSTTQVASSERYKSKQLEYLHQYERAAIELQEKLTNMSDEQWSDSDLESYFSHALNASHCAVAVYLEDNSYHPASMVELIGPYLTQALGNPCASWEPIKLLRIEDGTSPGDMVLQICPPEYYSLVNGELLPASYEIGVYAPFPYSPMQTTVYGKNNAWATVPSGVLYQIGYYRDSYVDLQNKRKAKKDKQQ